MSHQPLTNAESPTGGSRAANLAHSGEVEQARPTAHQDTKAMALACVTGARVAGENLASGDKADEPAASTTPPPKEPTYHYLGLGFAVRQYGIGTRKMNLKLPAFAHGAVKSAAPLQKDAASALPMARPAQVPNPLIVWPPDTAQGAPTPFTADMTSGGGGLMAEPTVHGYQLHPVANANLNKLLGKTLAVHIQRSGILKPNGQGNFKGDMLAAPEGGLETTEMLGVKLFVYLQARIEGKVVIRELLDGEVKAVIDEDTYTKRKLAEPNTYSDALCGSMPMIPGVYQVHVLLHDAAVDSEGAGGLALSEVHCDGDCLYP